MNDFNTLYQSAVTYAKPFYAYGHDVITQALLSSRTISTVTKAGKSIRKRVGTALSYRFLLDDKGWRVFVSVALAAPAPTTTRLVGALGIDLNQGHWALATMDRFGNGTAFQRIDLPLAGKATDQAKALIQEAAAQVVRQARKAGTPIVMERLDFRKKKAELENDLPKELRTKRSRQLSSFAYGSMIQVLKSAAFRSGVEIMEVNPAYTSVIGAVLWATQKG